MADLLPIHLVRSVGQASVCASPLRPFGELVENAFKVSTTTQRVRVLLKEDFYLIPFFK